MRYKNSQTWSTGNIQLNSTTELLVISGNVSGGTLTLPFFSSENKLLNAPEGLLVNVTIGSAVDLGTITINFPDSFAYLNGVTGPISYSTTFKNFEISYEGGSSWAVYDERASSTKALGTGIGSASDLNKPALNTVSDGDWTGVAITNTPFRGSNVVVLINGIDVNLSNGNKTGACYFSNDNGVTAKYINNIFQGDKLYWLGSLIGYQLEETDEIDILYAVSSID